MYIHRIIEAKLTSFLTRFPIVGVIGPRQSGKSTLIKTLLNDKYEYVTFDDPTTIRLFTEDPEGFFKTYANHVIFDEAQKVPEIFEYLKIAVDEDRDNYGKYIITGSAQFNLMQSITESLAGRIGLLTLLPFSSKELPAAYQPEAIFKGQYPELSKLKYQHVEDWYASYVSSYIEKDVRTINDVGNLRDFTRLLNLLASLTSQQLNMSELANQIGVSSPTIKRWISILEASFIIFLLPPYYENYGKRITKAPKIYFYDTGLVSYLTGIETEKQYKQGPMSGPIFENYVVSECIKMIHNQKLNYDLYYYRTNHGVEIDLIVDKKRTKDFIEIKHSSTFNPTMTKHLLTLKKDNTEEQDKYYVLYNGVKRNFKEVTVIPFNDYKP